MAPTQPIGSKPNSAATSSSHPINTWNTELAPVPSFNGGSPNPLANPRETKEANLYVDDQGDGMKRQGPHLYQGPTMTGFMAMSDKVT